MESMIILDEGDVKVLGSGFNVAIHPNTNGDALSIIINFRAVPKLIKDLQAWLDEQDEDARTQYLIDKFGDAE